MDDWPMLTWSLGWTGSREPRSPPSISMARLEMTSLAFMLVEVPDPVWKMSTTNWSSKRPSATSLAACDMASARPASSRSSSRFTSAAAPLISPIALTNDLGKRRPLMGKLRSARVVCAP